MRDYFFTPRQHQILQAIADGYTSRKALARLLGITPGTVHNHLDLMYKAAGVHSVAQLLTVAIRRGWVVVDRPDVNLYKETIA